MIRSPMKTLLNLILSLAVTGVLATSAFAEAPELEKSVPDFTLKDTNGKIHKLADFKGKKVVLEWVNFECPFVRKHYDSGNMQKLQETETSKGVVWLAVVSSAKGKQGYYPPKEMNARLKKEKFKGTALVYDTDGKIGKAYGAKTTPNLFIIDGAGLLKYKGAIDDKDSTDVADVPTSKNYVTSAMADIEAKRMIGDSQTKPYGCGIKYQ